MFEPCCSLPFLWTWLRVPMLSFIRNLLRRKLLETLLGLVDQVKCRSLTFMYIDSIFHFAESVAVKEKLKTAYQSLLIVSLNQPPSADYKNFSEKVKELAQSEYNFTYNEQVVCTLIVSASDCAKDMPCLFACRPTILPLRFTIRSSCCANA